LKSARLEHAKNMSAARNVPSAANLDDTLDRPGSILPQNEH